METYEQEMIGISPLATGHNIEFRNARASKIAETRRQGGRKFILMQMSGFKRIGNLYKNQAGKAILVDFYKRSSYETLQSRIAQLGGNHDNSNQRSIRQIP